MPILHGGGGQCPPYVGREHHPRSGSADREDLIEQENLADHVSAVCRTIDRA